MQSLCETHFPVAQTSPSSETSLSTTADSKISDQSYTSTRRIVPRQKELHPRALKSSPAHLEKQKVYFRNDLFRRKNVALGKVSQLQINPNDVMMVAWQEERNAVSQLMAIGAPVFEIDKFISTFNWWEYRTMLRAMFRKSS
ncbi:hypothetical protein QR680_006152 [Steinernema hermaphroditum]|uniref:Uncharacterized protein n=1 Tax=Steinernema hermaphroditum TaxID=289476 RepID=A0AA39LW27_9BILA|nr:hypothetical protein QR680_006152 [Steinernema hermaphroditum]